MECPKCSSSVPANLRICPSCGADCGYPNVRLARATENEEALCRRIKDAEQSAGVKNSTKTLDRFRRAVGSSRATVARPLAEVQNLLANRNNSYVSHHRMVRAGAKMVEDNEFEPIRTQFENAVFPNFHEEIVFAALSLDASGLQGYGGCTMVLKDLMIEERTSVFEENPYTFARRHELTLNATIPDGYRATWQRRADLAIAKLHGRIDANTRDDEFADILMSDDGTTGGSDFIEVHIYGAINGNSIESIAASPPRRGPERLTWRAIQDYAKRLGIDAEEV